MKFKQKELQKIASCFCNARVVLKNKLPDKECLGNYDSKLNEIWLPREVCEENECGGKWILFILFHEIYHAVANPKILKEIRQIKRQIKERIKKTERQLEVLENISAIQEKSANEWALGIIKNTNLIPKIMMILKEKDNKSLEGVQEEQEVEKYLKEIKESEEWRNLPRKK